MSRLLHHPVDLGPFARTCPAEVVRARDAIEHGTRYVPGPDAGMGPRPITTAQVVVLAGIGLASGPLSVLTLSLVSGLPPVPEHLVISLLLGAAVAGIAGLAVWGRGESVGVDARRRAADEMADMLRRAECRRLRDDERALLDVVAPDSRERLWAVLCELDNTRANLADAQSRGDAATWIEMSARSRRIESRAFELAGRDTPEHLAVTTVVPATRRNHEALARPDRADLADVEQPVGVVDRCDAEGEVGRDRLP